MRKAQAIKKAGSAYKLAQVLGITRQAVSQWGNSIPHKQELALRRIRPQWFSGDRAR